MLSRHQGLDFAAEIVACKSVRISADKRMPQRALTFLFFTVLIDVIGFGVVLPVTPGLIMELNGTDLSSASTVGGWLLFAFAITQFFFAPIMGNLSDRFGRRPVLLSSLAAFGLDYTITGFSPNLSWLFVGRIIAGATGASFSTANAYIADISKPEDRAKNFGLIGAAFGLGFILGPALGGIVGGFGTRIPFFVAGGLAFANALFGAFALPESLPESSRRLFQWARANPAGTLIHLKKYPMIYALAAVNFLWQLAHQVLPSTWTFYTMLKFNWNQNDVGYSLAFVGLCMTIVQGGLSGPIIKKLGERGAAIGGLLIGAIGFFGYALSPSPWIIYIFAAISSLSGLTYPSLNALMSGQVPATSQGELQGGNSSLISITSILGPLLMTQTFHMFATGPGIVFPGAPFALAGILAIGALMVLFISLARIARAPGPQASL